MGSAICVCGPDWFALARAARVISCGGVVAHATEGVWGLACDPFDRDAVRRIARLKGRPDQKGFIVIGAPGVFEAELDGVDAGTRAAIDASWPGAVTWIVANRRFPEWIAAPDATVAIRVPGHAQARRLAACCGGPLVSTSANPAGRPPARDAMAVRRYFGRRVDWILPGRVQGRRGPSEIRVAATGRVTRAV